MKRFLTMIFLCLLSLAGAQKLSAQHNYGVIGGVTFSGAKLTDGERGKMTQYHAGITYRYKIARGFSIQPSLIYHAKGAETGSGILDSGISVGYLELPVSFQWGPDLLLFRPFVDVTPYVGYGVNNKTTVASVEVKNSWDGLSRWEYGAGVGLGLDIWKFQIIARYNWNFGSFADRNTLSEIGQRLSEGSNFNGVTLSLAFLF